MNTNQYTQKTLEALQAAQQLAVEYQHNAMEPEHLLHALATQEQGLIPQLLQKLNVDAGSFSAAVAEKLSAMPRVSGSGRDPDKVYISQATDKVLSAAAREAKAMKDEYVSVEHVFLGLLDEPTQNCSDLFRAFSITKDKFLQQLTAVRGNQRVTNDNPEDTYNALQKYGQDLVDLARKQKLDPVIGTMACPVCGTALQPDDVWLKKGSSGWYTLSICPACAGTGNEAGKGVFQRYKLARRDGLHWSFARCVQVPDDAGLARWHKQRTQQIERMRARAEKQAEEAAKNAAK